MNTLDVNKILVAVIALGAAWRMVERLSLRSVTAKREAAAKLLSEAMYQEHMEAEAIKGRELASAHLATRRSELGLTSSEEVQLAGRGTSNAASFSEVVQ